jgi:hypothetical protein
MKDGWWMIALQREFAYNPPEKPRPKSDGLEVVSHSLGQRSPTQDSAFSQQTRNMSVSSESSGQMDKPQALNELKTRRLVVFISDAGHPNSTRSITRIITINSKSYPSLRLSNLMLLIGCDSNKWI